MQLIRLAAIVALCVCSVGGVQGQFTDEYDYEDDFNSRDTTSSVYDSAAINKNTFFDIFTGKPGKAAFYSLIIPGGGQFYNKRYWKIPLVWAIEGGAIYWYLWNDSKLDEWQTAYLGLLNDELESYRGITQASTAKLYRDKYRKNKEYAYIGMLLAHLLNVFDAFIDRHLIDFDIDDDLSKRWIMDKEWNMPSYSLISINIPINRKPKPKVKNLLGY